MIDRTHFSGQQAGEEIQLFLRRHPLSLIWDLRYVLLLFVAYIVASVAFADTLAPFASWLVLASLVLSSLLGLATLWIYAVWYYDVYVVTDRRLLDFARKPLIYERRDEAQLSRVQDIRVEFPNPAALLFDFGDVMVQTAGSRGTIKCHLVSRPRQVQARILQLAALQRAVPVAAAAPEAQQMRDYLGMPSPTPEEATAPAAPMVTATLQQETSSGRLRALFRPSLEVGPNDRVWRKHWWALVRATALSSGLFNTGVILGVVMLWKIGLVGWLAIPLTMIVVGGLWNLWNVLDWQNDLYILTDDRIIDIEKVPLISEDRREARLQQIQDVHYVMPGFISRLLDFGDVEVETAGRGGGFIFRSVPHPRDVQAEIFQRLDKVRKAAGLADRERQESDVLSVLYRYRQAAAQSPEDQPAPPDGG